MDSDQEHADRLVTEITDKAMSEIEGVLQHSNTMDDVRHAVEFHIDTALKAGHLAGQCEALVRQAEG